MNGFTSPKLVCVAALSVFSLSLARTTLAQKVDWIRQLGATYDDISFGVSADGSGGAYFCGYTEVRPNPVGFISRDAFVGRYNATGELLWDRQFGSPDSDSANSVAADGVGDVYVAGTTDGSLFGSSDGNGDIIVAKYNAAGDLLWGRQFGTPQDDNAVSVSADGLGSIYISGYTSGSLGGPHTGDEDAFVAKYNDSGNLLWVRQLGSTREDESTSVSADRHGNVYITGYTAGSLNGPSAYGEDAFVAKYDGAGDLLWTDQFGVHTDVWTRTVGYSISADDDGSVYVAGETTDNLFGIDGGAILCKFDASGNLLWGKQLELIQFSFGYGVSTDGQGNVYVSGRTPRSPDNDLDDPFVSKYDSSGNFLWTQQIGTSSEDYSWSVSADHDGNVYCHNDGSKTLAFRRIL